MTKAKLNEYLNKRVKVYFTDGGVIEGVLKYQDKFEYPYHKINRYYINDTSFLVGCVRKIEVLKNN